MWSCTDWRSTRSPSACRTAGSDSSGCFDLRLARSPSTSVQGSVELSWMCSILPLGVMLARPFAALLEALQQLILDLHVPGVVELAGLDDGARGRDRVAAALHLDGVEMRLVRLVIVGVDLAAHHVAGLEVDELVRPGADRLEVRRRVARFVAAVGVEQVLRDEHAAGADEGVGPERRRLFERHLDAVAVELLDLAILVAADRRGSDGRVAGVFPVEDAIVGGERLAVVPGHVALELPGHRQAVGREAAVLARRDLGREHGEEVAVRIPAGERLVEDARAVLVLGADRKMRVEQRRALPPEHLEGPAAAALRRLVGDLLLLLCPRRAAEGEHLARERRRDTERHHPPDERPPRQLAVRRSCFSSMTRPPGVFWP